nr:zinc finger, CCHC-type [Tanacetum cinerariifolium]
MTLGDHTDEFNKLILDLVNIDIKIEDEDQTLMLIMSLPLSFKKFVETLFYRKESLIIEDVLETLSLRELKKRTKSTKEEINDGLYVRGRLDYLGKAHSGKSLQFKSKGGTVGFKQLGRKQVGFKQLGHGVETRIREVEVGKHVWFEVELQGAQNNCEAEVFHEKIHLGIKVGPNIMVTGVPSQEGVESNVAEKKKVNDSIEANLGKLLKHNTWSTRWSIGRGSSTRK